MKKGLLFGIFMIVSVVLLAQENASAYDAGSAVAQRETHVTPAQALNVGYTFMRTGSGSSTRGGTHGSVSKQAMQLVYTGQTYDSLTGTTTDCYYVFALQPKGFVIVAADDRVEPILGYSYDNNFAVANMPDHVRAWLGNYEKQIQAVVKNNLQAEPASQAKWSRLKSGQSTGSRSGGSVGPLLTTTWDQGQYYNALCPADASGPGGHVWAGCVATAMAQIIHYWGYPTQGRGIHSYSSDYGTLEVNYNSASYDHTLMPNALTSTSSTQEVNAVATLIRDCGVAVNMGYSPEESGSMDLDARAALINFYRYSPNLSFAEKAYFSDSEWNAMLHADLDNSRPVFYSGQGSGGHAFVCDGYDSDGYYHFNFGWGGFADGWFLTSSLNPGGSNFSSSQAALFGIVPDTTGNVILGQTQGTSTFTVDEPLEFYHLMGHNAYEGGNYTNNCHNTIHFIPADTTNQIVADILDYEDQTLTFSDGDGNPLRNLVGGRDNDYSPVISSHNALNITYLGNMYYAGFKLSISQTDNNGCRMVSNITTFVDTTTVHLTWTENGTATQWEIEYGVKGFPLGTGTIYTADTNTATFSNLSKFTEYDFYIRPICGTNLYGRQNKVTVMVEAEYWQDIVTSQPAGYVYNAQTNSVEISTAEGLVWWAKKQSAKAYLMSDIDLSEYKWRPVELYEDSIIFDGQGHQITNAYMRENVGNVGFFNRALVGGSVTIENLGITNSYVKGTSGKTGGLGGVFLGNCTIRNCYISNSTIDGNDVTGGLVGHIEAPVINCYANANVVGNRWVGLLIGVNRSSFIRNCYAAGSIRHRSSCYMAGITSFSLGDEISNCYSVETEMGVVGYKGGSIITDTSTFVQSNTGWNLLTPVVIDDVTETDLLSALNNGVKLYNDSVYCTWVADTGNVNGGYPVFGNKLVVQCPNVTDVSVQNIIVNNNYAVAVSWSENSNASLWRIRYRRHDMPDSAYTYVTATGNPDTIFGIPLGYSYDFNVRAICDTDNRSGWSETKTYIVDLLYWTDIVTIQPAGYVEDANGNVEISSAEGLAWLAVITNGFHNQPQNSFTGKTVTLKSDINIEGYRWYSIGTFSGTFDGQNHRISNIYINGASGLFGFVYLGRVRNVNLIGGSVIGGNGGLIGTIRDGYEISNCHSSATVYGDGGALCGYINNYSTNTIIVSNCSSTGTVYGRNGCGNLIGTAAAIDGRVEVRNCYATGNVYVVVYRDEIAWHRGGLIGDVRGSHVENCFSTGSVEINNSKYYGKVIGSLDLNPHIHYLYGQDNVNAGWSLTGIYCEDIADTSQFHHDGSTNALLNSVSIDGSIYSDLLDALNAWVIFQNDSSLRLWTLDSISGYPVFGDYFVPSCYNPTDLTVSQATIVGDTTIKTRLSWIQDGEPDHWEVMYVAAGQSITSGEVGTIISTQNNPCILAGIPIGQPLDFYVRAICGDGNTSSWCGPVTYMPEKLHWTDVVTSKPEGYYEDANGNVYISSAEGLSWLSSISKGLNGAQKNNLLGKQIILTKDIDLSAYRWTAIGNLYGSFNGNNHVISGLYCNEFAGYQGLFGQTSGSISNLVLTQCCVHGKRTISGNGTSGTIGGIVGYASYNNISNCIVTGVVNGGGISGTQVGGSTTNSCFIGNDAFDGQSVNICESPLYAEIINCYVVNLPNRYYNGETNNSDFSGNGYSWTLNTPPYINGAFRTDLLDVLNAWVDVNNTNGQYRHWVADTAMVNGGYPMFENVSLPTVTIQDTVMVSGYYSWHGMVFTSDTAVTDTITCLNGYDSIVTHHIIISPALLTEISVDACGRYTWNEETYAETGDYVQLFSSVNGSDSVVVLRLTINPLTGVDEQIACDSHLWIDGVTYVADNSTATYKLQSSDGCDSIITLHLTVRHSNTGDTSAVACNSFDWYEQTNLTQSGDYKRSVTNVFGCDSVVTLHLTINHPVAEIVETIAYDSYIWDGDTLTESGDYSRTFTASNGCDSVVTMHLTVNLSTPPTVTTSTVSGITAYSAICGGTVTTDGGAGVTERGVCWSTSQSPTVADSHTTDGSGTGAFSSQLTSLEPNTIYYVRAYATNIRGTVYGEEQMFTTSLPFTCGENLVVNNNSYTTMNYGSQCWMTQNLRNESGSEYFSWAAAKLSCPDGWHMPTVGEWETLASYVDNNSTQDSNIPLFFAQPSHGSFWVDYSIPWDNNITYVFTCETSGQTISVNTYVYYEANETGLQVLTRCLRDENAFAALSTVTTDTVSNITPNTATCGGNVTADGGATVTARGVCWSTSQNPTIADSHTIDGSGAGAFSSQLTGLELNITYHVRAYATNSSGTAYGEEVIFTTGCPPVEVSITSDKIVICKGECTTLHAFGAGSYIWSTGENNSTITDCPAITTTYSVTGFDLYGCEATASFTLMVIDLTATPVVTVNNATVCDGSSVTLSVTNPNTDPSISYTWYRDSVVIPGATQAIMVDYPTAADNEVSNHVYTVVVSHDNSSCISDISEPTVVTVNFTNNTELFETACNSYEWNDSVYFQSGDYTQTFTDANGCDSIVTLHLIVNHSENSEHSETACDLFTWEGTTYTTSGDYTKTLQTVQGCDSIVTLHLTINHSENSEFAETACDLFTWEGTTYTTSGDYTKTLQTVLGCDSIVTLHLTVNYANSGDTTAVADDRFDWYEHTYLTMSGDYTHVFTNQSGCDSVVTLHLTVNNPTISVQDTVMTAGYFVWHGMVFTSDTVLFETIPVLDGYDSLVVYHIFVTPTPFTVLTVNACDSYTLNGQTYDESGDYVQTFPISSGMDSVVVLYLTISPADSVDFTETACESFTWEGTNYTQSGDYTKTFTNVNGCDSVVTLHLTIYSSENSEYSETACDSYTWEETTYTQSGDYTRTLTNASGCDSVVTLHLTIQFATYAQFADTACGSYEWNGTTYTVSGDYEQTFTAANGCDSVVTLHLTVNQPSTGTDVQTACGSYTWIDGISYSESNSTATYTLTNAVGCDSIVTLNLTIFPADSTDFAETVCESYEWNGETFITSGDYTRTLTNMNGYDSVVTLHLTVNQPVAELVEATACSSYEWNGQTYTISGDYEQSFTAANGCDSIVTLHLTVNHGTHNVETETACESYEWHGVTYNASGTYTYEYTNANGCVSVDTLHLTVNHGTHNVETETACESYEWHGVTYNASGTYTYDYTNASGCVSVDTLHLTVNHGTHNVETETACESFTWHGTEYTASGTYTYEYTNADGCASVDTLHLTINFAQSAQFAVTTADSCYIWNAETYCESGDYTQTLTAANGCDSTVTLHLTITVGIDDHNLSASMTVYPNPTNGMVNVQCTMNNVQVGTMEFHVFDAYGKLVDVVETRCTTSLQTAQIDLSGFAAGVYFVKAVADGNVVAVKKVVKQ